MTPCFAIDDIKTPKRYLLRGLWLGQKKPKRAIIFVHGVGGSMWSRFQLTRNWVNINTAVLVFDNRGHDKMARTRRASGKRSTTLGGAAHEVFVDCADDIQGAINYVRRQGVRNVFLAGHSTGCQKSTYWAYKRKGRGVKGIILLAPVSDYAAEMHLQGKKKIARAAAVARALVQRGKKHSLLPPGLWHEVLDAQRFLSLYTPDSIEEIFSYAQPKKNPRILKSVKKPLLVLWAEKDEYSDTPPGEIAAWFDKNTKSKHKIVVIPGVKHGFKGAERRVAQEIKKFIAG